MTQEWATDLFDVYRRCRKFCGWNQMVECHDKEDQNYFGMLDEQVDEGRIKINFEVPDVETGIPVLAR